MLPFDPAELTAVTYEEHEGVAIVTLNRPEVLNAFNEAMTRELHLIWRALRHHDPVRAVVLTAAGAKAFCVGIDRTEQEIGATTSAVDEQRIAGFGSTPFHFDDPGDRLGPRTADLWKPVIAAVNGMACGGAFYLLGEVDFIIAAEHATFFDPHVTYGMAAAFEPIHMLSRMPFGEVMRMSLMGNHERITAARAYEVGLVSEVVTADGLLDAAMTCARAIASAPALAVEATVRSVWAARELSRSQALGMGYALVGLGTSEASLAEGQARFASGERITPRLR